MNGHYEFINTLYILWEAQKYTSSTWSNIAASIGWPPGLKWTSQTIWLFEVLEAYTNWRQNLENIAFLNMESSFFPQNRGYLVIQCINFQSFFPIFVTHQFLACTKKWVMNDFSVSLCPYRHKMDTELDNITFTRS